MVADSAGPVCSGSLGGASSGRLSTDTMVMMKQMANSGEQKVQKSSSAIPNL